MTTLVARLLGLLTTEPFAAAGADALAAARRARPLYIDARIWQQILPRGWAWASAGVGRATLVRGALDSVAATPWLIEIPAPAGVQRAILAREAAGRLAMDMFDDQGWVVRAYADEIPDLWRPYFELALVALDGCRGSGIYRVDEGLHRLELRPEFAAFDGLEFDYDDAAQDREDNVRILADMLIAGLTLTGRLHRSGFCDAPADADLAPRLMRATKYVADADLLGRALGLVEKPDLRARAGLWARTPGELVWFELPHPDHDDGVVGFLIECADVCAERQDVDVTVFERLGESRGLAIPRAQFTAQIGGFDAAPDAPHAELLVAVLALATSPRLTRTQAFRAGPVLTRRRRRAGLPALAAFDLVTVADVPFNVDEIGLRQDVDRPENAAGNVRRHRVRGFWRWKRQKLEFVREHWRGNEERGTVDHRYRVTANPR